MRMRVTYLYLFMVTMSILSILISCKDESRFVEPNYVLRKWASAIQQMNYREYAECEAHPKSEAVFREMYREYYLADLMATEVDDAGDAEEMKDAEGLRYARRHLEFEAAIVQRKTGTRNGLIRGSAEFIKYIDGRRAKEGWLLSNRTLIHVPR